LLKKIKDKRLLSGPGPTVHGGNIHAFAHALQVATEEVLDFSASINPLGPPRDARRVYQRTFHKIIHYPEPYAKALVQALGEYHEIDPASVLVGNGSTQLIYGVARLFRPRQVLLVAPLFSEHVTAFQLNGVKTEYCFSRPPLFAFSSERLARLLTAKRYDVLVLTNPNSPTGSLMAKTQVNELIRVCRQTQTRLLVDETFIDWVEGESVKQLAAQDDVVVVLRSLTKFFALPGLRVGYAIASPKIIRQLQSWIEPWSVNTVAQEVGKACLREQRFIARSRAFMDKERRWLGSQLRLIPGLRVFPSSANFLLLQTMTKEVSVLSIAEQLAREKMLIRACDNFVGLGRRFFRVAVRTRAENRRLLEALAPCLGSPASGLQRNGVGGGDLGG